MKVHGIGECHCMALRRAARRISEIYDEALASTGLRATQFAILAALSVGDGMNVNELAERLDLDRTTTGKNLRPLERDGLVAVGVSEADRRSRAIALTAAGRKKVGAAYPLWRGAQERFEGVNGRKRVGRLRKELGGLRMEGVVG